MQTVWSRSIRPQSTCRCISCTNPLPSILSRRTTTGIARKRLTAGDAFTLLLGPVLGGAYIADTKVKEARRREWDEKIAVVQAEVEQMRRNEVKTYHIRSRNLRRLPSLSRSYSSATAASLDVADEEDSIEAAEWSYTDGSESESHQHLSTLITNDGASGSGEEQFQGQIKPELKSATIEKCKRLQRLVAIKLAIRMILHIHIGKSPRYIFTSSDYAYDQGSLPQNANELIRHLKQVSSTLSLMNSDELRSSWRAYQSLTRGQTCSLDKDICQLARQFRRGEINVTQLVEQFAGKLLSSADSPTVHGYIPFLRVLSRARFDELGFMIDGTMMEARLSYDQHAIFTLLWQYGKNKEAQFFDKLIKKLTTDSAIDQFGEQWLWRNIRGTVVPVPPSQDPQILQILIYAGLKCNQPHRAEAWGTIMAWERNAHRWLSHVIRNFLKYYSAHKNWNRGFLWLKKALDSAEMLAAQSIRNLQRVAFAMLEFCMAHDEHTLYQEILKAAADCRLGVYAADPDLTLTEKSSNILREWELCHASENIVIEAQSPLEKARMFVRQLQHIHDLNHGKTAGNFNTDGSHGYKERLRVEGVPRRPSESGEELGINGERDKVTSYTSEYSKDKVEVDQWKELCRTQQAQLDLLKRQLDSFKSGSTSDSALSERDRVSYPAFEAENTTESPNITMVHAGPGPKLRAAWPSDHGGRPLRDRAMFAWRPLSPKRKFMTIPGQPFRRPFSQDSHQCHPPSPFFPEESEGRVLYAINPDIHPARLIPIPDKDVRLTSFLEDPHPSPPALPHPSATLPELHRALDFCTCITSILTTHILGSPRIRPLYALVSTLSSDLLIEILADGTFSHFLRSMITEWEEEVFWDKLMVEFRRRRAEVEGEAEAEEVEKKRGTPLPITHKISDQSPTQRSTRLRESGSKMPLKKVGYGALRLQLGVCERRQARL